MALNYDLTKVHDYKSLYRQPDPNKEEFELDPVTEVLVHLLSLVVGINEITTHNASKVHERLEKLANVGGLYLSEMINGRRFSRRITFNEVKRHVGLHTNGAKMTDAQFTKHLKEVAYEAAQRMNRQYEAEREDMRKNGADTYVVVMNYPDRVHLKAFKEQAASDAFLHLEITKQQERHQFKNDPGEDAPVADRLEWWNRNMEKVSGSPHLISTERLVRR